MTWTFMGFFLGGHCRLAMVAAVALDPEVARFRPHMESEHSPLHPFPLPGNLPTSGFWQIPVPKMVFISYSKDLALAQLVCDHLERGRVTCWLASRDIPGGVDYGGAIVEALRSCRAMVLLFSQAANESDQVRREVKIASEIQLPILPVRFEQVAPSTSMIYYLGGYQWIDAFDTTPEVYLERLTRDVNAIVGPITPEAIPFPASPDAPTRLQQRVDRLMDEADSCERRDDWARALELYDEVLDLVPDNTAALKFRRIAARKAERGGVNTRPTPDARSSPQEKVFVPTVLPQTTVAPLVPSAAVKASAVPGSPSKGSDARPASEIKAKVQSLGQVAIAPDLVEGPGGKPGNRTKDVVPPPLEIAHRVALSADAKKSKQSPPGKRHCNKCGSLSSDQHVQCPACQALNWREDIGAVDDALKTLEGLAKGERNPEKKALCHVRIASLYQEKMHDFGRAVEHLNLALDANPDLFDAFLTIDKLLTQTRQWESLAENYRRMLERLEGRGVTDLEYRLFFSLGEILRSRLKQTDNAILAYSAAAIIKPEERKSHEILAQLYEDGEDQLDRAVEEHRAIIMAAPLSPEAAPSYKAMRRIYLEMKALDKAFVATSILVGLGLADSQEIQFLEGNLEPGLPWFKSRLDSQQWESLLMVKAENKLLGRIFSVMYVGLGAELGAKDLKDLVRANDLKALGVTKKDEFDFEQRLPFVEVYKAVAKALGAMQHRVYLVEPGRSTKFGFTSPPAILVGSDIVFGLEKRDLAFRIGRLLAFMTPTHFLASDSIHTDRLEVFLLAAMKHCRPETRLGLFNQDLVVKLGRLIEHRMPQQQKNQLSRLMTELSRNYGLADFGTLVANFKREIECSAIRAGTLVCGDVNTALRVAKSDQFRWNIDLFGNKQIEEILRFAVSDDHFVLRRALGINIEGT